MNTSNRSTALNNEQKLRQLLVQSNHHNSEQKTLIESLNKCVKNLKSDIEIYKNREKQHEQKIKSLQETNDFYANLLRKNGISIFKESEQSKSSNGFSQNIPEPLNQTNKTNLNSQNKNPYNFSFNTNKTENKQLRNNNFSLELNKNEYKSPLEQKISASPEQPQPKLYIFQQNQMQNNGLDAINQVDLNSQDQTQTSTYHNDHSISNQQQKERDLSNYQVKQALITTTSANFFGQQQQQHSNSDKKSNNYCPKTIYQSANFNNKQQAFQSKNLGKKKPIFEKIEQKMNFVDDMRKQDLNIFNLISKANVQQQENLLLKSKEKLTRISFGGERSLSQSGLKEKYENQQQHQQKQQKSVNQKEQINQNYANISQNNGTFFKKQQSEETPQPREDGRLDFNNAITFNNNNKNINNVISDLDSCEFYSLQNSKKTSENSSFERKEQQSQYIKDNNQQIIHQKPEFMMTNSKKLLSEITDEFDEMAKNQLPQRPIINQVQRSQKYQVIQDKNQNAIQMQQQNIQVNNQNLIQFDDVSKIQEKNDLNIKNNNTNTNNNKIEQIQQKQQQVQQKENEYLKESVKDIGSEYEFEMKQQEQSQQQYQKFNLFEEFFIITADKQQCREQIKEVGHSEFLDPQILFSYPGDQEDCDKRSAIPKFVFPFGVEVQKSKKTDSLSELNQIIFGGTVVERYKNCFVFAIKSKESYMKQKMLKHLPPLLVSVNPNALLYCISVTTKDFLDDENDQEMVKQHLGKDNCFFTVNNTFCIMTYFPFINFWIDLISSIIAKIKIKKLTVFSEYTEQDFSNIDVYFYQTIEKEIRSMLNVVYETQLPGFNTVVKMKVFEDDPLFLSIPEKEECNNIEAEWGMCLSLQNMGVVEYCYILCAIMLEKSIVFTSTNRALLTATILLFHTALKPFKWPHPLVFTVSDDLMHIFDSPVPIICGLHKDFNFVIDQELVPNYNHITFVNLDDFAIFNQMKEIFKFQFYDRLCNYLDEYFKTYNWIKREEQTKFESNVFQTSDKEEQLVKSILRETSQFLKINIMDKLPQNPILNENRKSLLDYKAMQDKIIEESGEQDRFLESFLQTQIFTFYTEEYYEI